MTRVAPPVPDPKLTPKPAAEMAAEGDREGPILTDGSRTEKTEAEGKGGTGRDPQFARNGE